MRLFSQPLEVPPAHTTSDRPSNIPLLSSISQVFPVLCLCTVQHLFLPSRRCDRYRLGDNQLMCGRHGGQGVWGQSNVGTGKHTHTHTHTHTRTRTHTPHTHMKQTHTHTHTHAHTHSHDTHTHTHAHTHTSTHTHAHTRTSIHAYAQSHQCVQTLRHVHA